MHAWRTDIKPVMTIDKYCWYDQKAVINGLNPLLSLTNQWGSNDNENW